MGLKNSLLQFEEQASKQCTITLVSKNGYRGGAELFVENCKCVKSCDGNFIALSVFGMDIKVVGEPLVLENFGVNGVKISGVIHSLSFDEDGNF